MSKITDAGTAVADIAYRLSEVIAVYPITPSSGMSEHCEAWSSSGRKNLFGDAPEVIEMQSEAGSIAVVHGSSMSGALSTTFTSSQGLLLMIPSLYKLAGERTPCVIHVATRTVASHALSIFCDHSDVMSVRQTGCAILGAVNGQQAQDMALVASVAALRSRMPFIHFFDGFITSHTLCDITPVTESQTEAIYPYQALTDFRVSALTPDSPTLRGATADPDVFFQCREAQNTAIRHTETVVAEILQQFAEVTGREYRLIEYVGAPDAERVIVAMGSVIDTLNADARRQMASGEKVGVMNVRLYRPFPVEAFLQALPDSVRTVAVLDRTKEPGATGEPLYLDVIHSLYQSSRKGIEVTRGRYGLAGKPFYPEDAGAIFRMMARPPLKPEFVIGINDDITGLSLPAEEPRITEAHVRTAIMYGFGGDGSVSAARNLIHTWGHFFGGHVNAQFHYDSKKSGNTTTSCLRMSSAPIETPYPLRQAGLITVARLSQLSTLPIARQLGYQSTLILNTDLTGSTLWAFLPVPLQHAIQAQKVRVVIVDASDIVRQHGLKDKPSIVMQVAALAILSPDTQPSLIKHLKDQCRIRLKHKQKSVLYANLACIEASMQSMNDKPFEQPASSAGLPQGFPDPNRTFDNTLTSQLLAGLGETLPVSAFPDNGVWATGTSRTEKRNIADQLPMWDPDLCTQCGYCVAVCPHSAIRAKVIPATSDRASLTRLKTSAYRSRTEPDSLYSLQVSPDDCTGCQLCANVCPAVDRKQPERRALVMTGKEDSYQDEKQRYEAFTGLPEHSVYTQARIDVKSLQTVMPYFEFPNACAGCGETPYIRILTQLFGDRLYIANATGCSSIFGGNLPTTPYSKDSDGRGPAWANSLFEDNAEFGLGIKLAADALSRRARSQLNHHPQSAQWASEDTAVLPIPEQRRKIQQWQSEIDISQPQEQELQLLMNYLVEKQVWLIGGDGWAYDIGFGGLDHVLRSGKDINILVLDTQCYSNTGGQKSKSTPLGTTAKLCSQPNTQPAKDLISLYQTLPGVFVARIALGANMNQTIKALKAAGEHPGPSLVVTYAPCIEHGYDLSHSLNHTQDIVRQGEWPLMAEAVQDPDQTA